MMGFFKRYGFAAVVAIGLALMTVVVAGKALLTSGDGGAAKAAPASGEHRPGGGGAGGPAAVTVVAVGMHDFNDAIQVIGTAQARESIVITPKVADTIRAIRFDSGAHVRQGQVLVEMSSVEQGADLAEARANNAQAQENLRRYQELFNRGFASQAQIDTVRAAADAAQARVDAGGSRISDRTIRAPFSGVIGLRTASPGQYIQPGTQIGTLDDVSQMKLDFDVPETDVSRVAAGVSIVAITAAYPNRQFTGVIANVDSRIDPATRTVRVRAILPNDDSVLRPGMLMTVEVRSNPRSALAIPEIAIIDAADGSYVFRVAAGDRGATAERVLVHTGQRNGGVAEILSGLNPGDMVVTEGIQSVRPGQPVRVTNGQAQRNDAEALELRPRG
jgi:membrane fusion protein (multidrug efflux system)